VLGRAWEWVGSASVTALRRINELLVADPRVLATITATRLERRHLSAIGLDFVRGALVSGAGWVGGWALLKTLTPYWSMGPAPALGVLGIGVYAVSSALLPVCAEL